MNIKMKINLKKLILTIGIFFAVYNFSFADQINDKDFKFKISIPTDWEKTKSEETAKKDAISYSFNRKDGKNALMIIAFKVNAVKELDDLIYTLEKDFTLKIPPRSGEYTTFDNGTYDGKVAVYKDNEFTETIYYYRTKNSDASNYAYMVRFITPNTYYNADSEVEIKNISNSFSPTN